MVPISTIIGGKRPGSTPSAVWDNPMSAFGGKAEADFAESQERPVNMALLAMFTVGLRRRVRAAGYTVGYAMHGTC